MRRRAAIALLVALGCVLAASPALAAPIVLANEPLTGTSTAAGTWTTGGYVAVPCLTAAPEPAPLGSIPACPSGPYDADGSGTLRLTDNYFQGGFALLNSAFSSAQGIRVDFDMYQWGGDGADGLTVFFANGASAPTTSGNYGRSLGYASGDGNPGIVGAYAGVGFDWIGNFSMDGSGAGGPGWQPNRVVVRGSEASDYLFIDSTPASGPLSVAGSRAGALRHVSVSLSPAGQLWVWVDYGAGPVLEMAGVDVTAVSGAVPATLKVGFSAGTGGLYNFHEVNHVAIQTPAPDLALAATATKSVTNGYSSRVRLAVSNAPFGIPTNAPITVTSTMPAGLTATSAAGAGWACSIVADTVTCTRPGSGAASLLAGATAPRIFIEVTRTALTSLPATLDATVSVLDDGDATNDEGSVLLAAGSFSSAQLADTGVDDRIAPIALGLLLIGGALTLAPSRLRTLSRGRSPQ